MPPEVFRFEDMTVDWRYSGCTIFCFTNRPDHEERRKPLAPNV
jgi:hypothetical protein